MGGKRVLWEGMSLVTKDVTCKESATCTNVWVLWDVEETYGSHESCRESSTCTN